TLITKSIDAIVLFNRVVSLIFGNARPQFDLFHFIGYGFQRRIQRFYLKDATATEGSRSTSVTSASTKGFIEFFYFLCRSSSSPFAKVNKVILSHFCSVSFD